MQVKTMMQLARNVRSASVGPRITARGFSNTGKSTFSGTDKIGIAVFSGISAVAFGLGVWQYKRYNWKVSLIKDGREKLKYEKEELSPSTNVQELLGKQVTFRGTFDHSREVLIGLRAPPSGTFESAQGMGSNPQGYFILTPMKLSFGPIVYVNRGWVPREHKRIWSRPEGEVSVTAVVGEPETAGSFAPQNRPESGTLLWVNRPDLLAASRLTEDKAEYEIFEELAADCTAPASSTALPQNDPNTLPIKRSNNADDYGKHYVTPETHMAYCFTWFSLSALGFWMTYMQFRRKGKINKRIIKK